MFAQETQELWQHILATCKLCLHSSTIFGNEVFQALTKYATMLYR